MNKQNLLFTPMEINGVHLKIRLVRSATYEHMATEDGKVFDSSAFYSGYLQLIISHFDNDRIHEHAIH